jgi:hypothetical protein
MCPVMRQPVFYEMVRLILKHNFPDQNPEKGLHLQFTCEAGQYFFATVVKNE